MSTASAPNGMEELARPGYQWAPVVDGVFALAVWDHSWGSYNDCYLVVDDRGLTLVDTGKSDHGPALLDALTDIGRVPGDVRTVLATHGHHDHVGGSGVFPDALKKIHREDHGLIPEPLRVQFQPDLPSTGTVGNFECVLLGQHTTGSVGLFHHPTSVLFCGDHVCFFGAPLPDGQLVSPAADTRDRFRKVAAAWHSTWPPAGQATEEIDADLARRPPQDQRRYDFERFQVGVAALRQFRAAALCTGHGPVLVGGIQDFLADLAADR